MKVLGNRTLAAAAALLALAAFAPGAHAFTLNISTSGPLAEDQVWQLHATGTAETNTRLWIKYKPAGGPPCAQNQGADSGQSFSGFDDEFVAAGNFSRADNIQIREPGDLVLCAWLQNNSGSTTPDAKAGPLTVTIRSNQASIAFNVPQALRTDEPMPVTLTGTTEVQRSLYVGLIADIGSCPANWDAITNRLRDDDDYVNGSYTKAYQWTAPAPGTYRLCAYIQEHSGDLNPEAVQQQVVVVQESAACQAARAALSRAQTARSTASSKVKSTRKALRKARGRAAKGRANRRYQAARRALARASTRVSTAQQNVTNRC